ncbi:MAG: hypothetical protein CMP59_07845 [Flavobacteriales bacterium]|nr:hypothetical protein [Flavobacteriales bacterium]
MPFFHSRRILPKARYNRLHRKLLLERIGGLAKRKAPRDPLEIIWPSLACKSGDSDFLWPGLPGCRQADLRRISQLAFVLKPLDDECEKTIN